MSSLNLMTAPQLAWNGPMRREFFPIFSAAEDTRDPTVATRVSLQSIPKTDEGDAA